MFSAAFSVPSSLPETPASSSDSFETLSRNLSTPSALLASASENFCVFSTVCGQRPAHVLGEALELVQHVVGALEDVLRGLQQIGDRRRIGGDFGNRAGRLGLVEQVRLVEIGALDLDVGLAGQAGKADIGLASTW